MQSSEKRHVQTVREYVDGITEGLRIIGDTAPNSHPLQDVAALAALQLAATLALVEATERQTRALIAIHNAQDGGDYIEESSI